MTPHVPRTLAAALGAALASLFVTLPTHAQNFPIYPNQRATAEQVAQSGVPLSELAPNAPEEYTVKRGDTLWGISGLFLKTPWRWPELWGLNMDQISNPHRIYPGQTMYLDKSGGRARLRMGKASGSAAGGDVADAEPIETVRLSPRTRSNGLNEDAIPTLAPNLTEAFLTDALIVELDALEKAPRLVANKDSRVLVTRGERAYARGNLPDADSTPRYWRIYRNAKPLRDPNTQAVLGYEAQFIGRAELIRGESVREVTDGRGRATTDIVPATVDILDAKEEIRPGDRMLPEPPRELLTYAPRVPPQPTSGQIVSVYGNAVRYAAQNQVVVLNRGARDGLERGHVLALMSDGRRLIDRTNGERTAIKLPDERNGLMMVFRTFDRLSYALVLQISEGVQVGDRFGNPR